MARGEMARGEMARGEMVRGEMVLALTLRRRRFAAFLLIRGVKVHSDSETPALSSLRREDSFSIR